MHLRFWIITCLVFITLAAPVLGAADPISINDYQGIISSIARGLQSAHNLEDKRHGSGTVVLRRTRNSIPSSVLVQMGENRITADLSWIKEEIDAVIKAPKKERAKRLEVLCQKVQALAEVDTGGPHAAASRAEASRILEDILARNEYKISWFDKLALRIQEAIYNFLSKLNVPESTVNVIGWTLLIIVIIAFTAAIVWLILRIIGYYSFKRPDDLQEEEKQHIKPVKRSVEAMLEAAENEASQGNYREAFRYTYLAAILLLDKAKLVTYADSGTNWEYLRTLKKQSAGDTAQVFQSMTLRFDELVYGKRTITRDDYIQSRESFDKLEAAV